MESIIYLFVKYELSMKQRGMLWEPFLISKKEDFSKACTHLTAKLDLSLFHPEDLNGRQMSTGGEVSIIFLPVAMEQVKEILAMSG